MRTFSISRLNKAPGTFKSFPAVGFVLVELVLVVLIIGLVLGLVVINIEGILQRTRMDRDVDRFVHTLRLAVEQAVFRSQTVIVDVEVMDGYYVVYPEPGKDQREDEVEPLVPEQQLKWSYIDNIEYADGKHQYSGRFQLKATPQGWEDAVLLTLTDEFEQMRYVRCDRITSQVASSRYPLEIPQVRKDVSMNRSI